MKFIKKQKKDLKNEKQNKGFKMCMTIRDKYIDPFTDFGFKHK
jgi:hypothetical protein